MQTNLQKDTVVGCISKFEAYINVRSPSGARLIAVKVSMQTPTTS